ncbi:unnamed protein product [Macrosiphum euphorbiae]|uniref:SWIM-type domain-containing protein n=1 Tax=Macrosiphum euphorbiae TaxID=13131 RepID=A0AAV0VTV7_9HEMI|nr:unnamed protein product [Macrosiphum euphorbiae]
MTDDSSAERNALKSAMWRWLWDSKHEIANQDRKHLMKLFRSVAYADNEENLVEMVDILMKTDQTSEKSTLRTRGHNTNNIVESSIRVFKDIVLERCKAFNAAVLIDFVGNTLKDYHRRRLLKYANVRISKPELHFQKFFQLSKGLIVQKENEYLYYVSSSTDENMFYSVDIENETCDCPAGRGGKFCKHQCAVFLQDEKLKLQNLPNLNFDDRVVLAKLAIGSVDETFFQNMNQLDANYDKSSNETEAQDNFDECMVVSTNSNILRLNLDNAPVDENNSVKILEITKNLQDNLNRITTLASESNTLYTHKIMSSLTTKLSAITSSSEALSFLAQVYNKKRGRQIGVQPTSLARRKVGLTLGSKRVQAGRPTESAPPNKKRKRNLASNIDDNKCSFNSKSH